MNEQQFDRLLEKLDWVGYELEKLNAQTKQPNTGESAMTDQSVPTPHECGWPQLRMFPPEGTNSGNPLELIECGDWSHLEGEPVPERPLDADHDVSYEAGFDAGYIVGQNEALRRLTAIHNASAIEASPPTL